MASLLAGQRGHGTESLCGYVYQRLSRTVHSDRVTAVVQAVADYAEGRPSGDGRGAGYESAAAPPGEQYSLHGLPGLTFLWALRIPGRGPTPWTVLGRRERIRLMVELARVLRGGTYHAMTDAERESINRSVVGPIYPSLHSANVFQQVDAWVRFGRLTLDDTAVLFNRALWTARQYAARAAAEPGPSLSLSGLSPSAYFARALRGEALGVCRDCAQGWYYLGLELGAPPKSLRYQAGTTAPTEPPHAWVEIREGGRAIPLDSTAGRSAETAQVIRDGRANRESLRVGPSRSRVALEQPLWIVPAVRAP